MRTCIITLAFLLFFSLNANIPEKYNVKYETLKSELLANNIPELWIIKNINHTNFTMYYNMPKFFTNMAENKVKSSEKDLTWYMNHFGVEKKIISGENFIRKHQIPLNFAEKQYNIPKEIITAILGIESNFGDTIFKGTFFTFPALISQYLLLEGREKYSVAQLVALYQFEKITNLQTYNFIGSFAGACGWGQFIPSSLLNYFVSKNNDLTNVDLYDIENNIFSVAHYLLKNAPPEFNTMNESDLYKIIYKYNRSDAYVKAVLYIYNGILEKKL